MDWEVTTLDFGITGVAAITVLCFLLGQAVKATGKLCRWIPVICGAAGCVLGILGWKLIPDFPAYDPITAAAVALCPALLPPAFTRCISRSRDKNAEGSCSLLSASFFS